MTSNTWTQRAGMTSDTDTDNVESYAEQALASKNAAATSATAAATSASNSAASATSSQDQVSLATAQAVISTNQATASASSASSSAGSATTAGAAQTAAETAKAGSETAQTAAETAETAAETARDTSVASAATSTSKAAESAASAAAAATSQASANTSSNTATTKASEAATSATASEASKVASVAAQAASETAQTASEAAQSASETAKTGSETAETNSAASASTSTTQAGISTTKAGEAAASATAAASSATASASSATASAGSATSAAAALDEFTDLYLGSKGSDPTLDNDGNALQTGALYYNNSDNLMKFYSGSAWIAAYATLSGALIGTNNLSDVSSVSATRTNLGLGTAQSPAFNNVTVQQDPTAALQLATKQYVDTIAAAGLHYHAPVRVEAPTALTVTYDNGSSGVGATLTNAGTQAAISIDGVTLQSADRVLVYTQTAGAQNGVYTVTTVGSASTNWVMTRAVDADSYGPSDPDAFGEGDAFFVLQGDTGAGELYVMNTSGTITFGTTAISFTQVASTAVYTAGGGIDMTGTVFSHADTSSQGTVDNSGGTVIQDVTLDTYGHVSGLTSHTLTASDVGAATSGQGALADSAIQTNDTPTFGTTTVNGNVVVTGTVDGRDVAVDGAKLDGIEAGAKDDQTITAGSGLSGGGTGDVTLSHADTSSVVSSDNSGNTFIQDLTFDTYGHVTAVATGTVAVGDGTLTVSGTGALGGSGTFTANQSGNTTISISHDDTSSQGSVNNSGAAVIQDVTLDGYGHVTALGSHTLTLANLGYTGATNANYITNNNQLTNGAGYTTYTSNQATNTSNSVTFGQINCADVYSTAWLRTTGTNGVYFGTYTGGWNMTDSTWIRSYNNKSILTSGTMQAGTFNTTSDRNTKKDIKPIENALEKVQQLGGYSFTFKETDEKSSGVIAQEVQKVMPELVQEGGEGHLTVQYGNMVGLLIEAIKEQQAQIDALTAKLNG
tara:strand:+ start:1899 stop:4802 length:2904 start_codon:yes stop_codon:yes gene_type:complete